MKIQIINIYSMITMKNLICNIVKILNSRRNNDKDNDIKPIFKSNEAKNIDTSFIPYSKDFTYKPQ